MLDFLKCFIICFILYLDVGAMYIILYRKSKKLEKSNMMFFKCLNFIFIPVTDIFKFIVYESKSDKNINEDMDRD